MNEASLLRPFDFHRRQIELPPADPSHFSSLFAKPFAFAKLSQRLREFRLRLNPCGNIIFDANKSDNLPLGIENGRNGGSLPKERAILAPVVK